MALSLISEWVPGSSYTYAWVAMDNQGYLAKMYNNNSGWLPKVLLSIPDIKLYLDDLSEYIRLSCEKYLLIHPEDKIKIKILLSKNRLNHFSL